MSSELVEIRKKINSLPEGEKKMLLRELERPEAAALGWQALAVYRAIRREVTAMSERDEAAERFVRDYGQKKFDEKLDFAFQYISATREVMRRPQVEALLCLVFNCLASDMRQRSVPVTGKTLLDQLNYAPHAVDQRYPGYAEARMLHCIA